MKRRYFHRHTIFFLAFILSLTTIPLQTYAATSQTDSIENMYMTHYYPATGRTEAYTYTFDSATRATYSNDTQISFESPYTPPTKAIHSSGSSRSLIGEDNRSLVEDVTQSPYCKIVYIRAVYSYGTRRGIGVLIGPDLVLTCGHLIYDIDTDEWAESYEIYTEATNPANYEEFCYALRVTVHNNYINNSNYYYDWAFIQTSTDIGNRQGWMGFSYHANPTDFVGSTIEIAGYPRVNPATGLTNNLDMYTHSGNIIACPSKYTVHTYADATDGQSGSPYFDGNQFVWAVHRGGNSNSNPTYNVGTKIIPELFHVLRAAKNEGIAKWGN